MAFGRRTPGKHAADASAHRRSGQQDLEEVNDCGTLQEKVGEYQAGGEHNPNYERYLIQRSVELGCTEHIPDDFGLA
jgi:hypothetical protein